MRTGCGACRGSEERIVPIYEYVCPTCGVFEEMQKISDPVLTACPKGHAGVERKMSVSGFILKGSGWYVTDYARKRSNGAGVKDGQSAGGASSDKAGGSDSAEKSGDTRPSAASPARTSTGSTGSGA